MKLLSIILNQFEVTNLAKELANHKCVSQIHNLNPINAKSWANKELAANQAMLVVVGKFKKIKAILGELDPKICEYLSIEKLSEINSKHLETLQALTAPMLVGTRLQSADELNESVNLDTALLNPAAKYGGLYAPINLPLISKKEFKKLAKLNYEDFLFDKICN